MVFSFASNILENLHSYIVEQRRNDKDANSSRKVNGLTFEAARPYFTTYPYEC